MTLPTPAYDIAIIGWGTRGKWQLTLEHLHLLQQAKHIVLSPGPPQDLIEYLGEFPAKIHDLNRFYQEGRVRSRIYQDIARYVLDLSASEGSVAFLQHGHPLIYSSPTEKVVRGAKKRKLKMVVASGISSIDEIFSLLRLDIIHNDLQICHATQLYKQRKKINPKMDLMLMQIGALDDKKARRNLLTRPETVNREPFEKLYRHLLKFYSPSQKMYSLCVLASLDGSDLLLKATLKDLVKLGPYLHYGHTLYFPAKK